MEKTLNSKPYTEATRLHSQDLGWSEMSDFDKDLGMYYMRLKDIAIITPKNFDIGMMEPKLKLLFRV